MNVTDRCGGEDLPSFVSFASTLGLFVMSFRAENWTLFYANLPSNVDVNSKMAKIMGFNLSNSTQEEWISNLKQNPGLSLLLVNGFHELMLLHQVNFLQENLFCSDSKLLGLSGGLAEASVFRIDPSSASTGLEMPVSVWRDLKNAASAESLESLTVPEQNPSVFHVKNSLIIPPLVLITILEAKSLCPVVLIPILSAKFHEFDRSNTQVKACISLRPVLEFLWLAYKKKVPPSTIALDTSCEGLDWSAQLHFANIQKITNLALPPPFLSPPPLPRSSGNTPPMESIAGDIRIIRDATERQLL